MSPTDDVAAEVLAVLEAQFVGAFAAAVVTDGETAADLVAYWDRQAAAANQRAAAIRRLRESGWTATQHPIVGHLVPIAEVASEERASMARREAQRLRYRAERDGSVTTGP